MWTKLLLFRGQDQNIDKRTLGEILLAKASEGVKVFVMVWSEKTSNQLKTEGVMGTHDMETFNYFKVEIKLLLNSLISHVIATIYKNLDCQKCMFYMV